MIDHFNRKGLNGSDYFIYQNVKVFPMGKSDAILEREALSAHERIHGVDKDSGVVVQD